MKSNDDQRTTMRKPLRVNAVVRLPARSPLDVHTIEVGLEGMSLAAVAAFESNSLCEVEFALPLSHGKRCAVTLSCRVVYSVLSTAHGFKVGLHFIAPTQPALAALGQYMHPA